MFFKYFVHEFLLGDLFLFSLGGEGYELLSPYPGFVEYNGHHRSDSPGSRP